MKEKSEKVIREALSEMFDILAYKVRNGVMTVDEMNSVLSIFEQSGGVKATVKELSVFYGQTEDNVRHIIHRNIMPRPIRKVYYDFESFSRCVPKRWKLKRLKSVE